MKKICIDARIEPGVDGGIEQVVLGLAQGFSKMTNGDEKYYFLTNKKFAKLLKKFIGGACQIIISCEPDPPNWIINFKKKYPNIKKRWHLLKYFYYYVLGIKNLKLATSQGIINENDFDLIHFVSQTAFLTNIPNIYHPHDLQHIHLPNFFSKWHFYTRETFYKKFCEQANIIAVSSSWTKSDIIKHYGISNEKIKVIPLAPPTEGYPKPSAGDIIEVKKKYYLPSEFAFYPAQTWPHKNHISLIKAVAAIRDKHHIVIPLVFSGRINDFFQKIKKCIQKYQMNNQVQFLGYVTPLELQVLYKLCRCVVIPSKFESASFPLWEAFAAGVPAACSNVTSLPQQAGDAALIFDPNNIKSIENAVRQLWINEKLRSELVKKGKQNFQQYNWKKTCYLFRTYYRMILRADLSKAEHRLCHIKPVL